jgi:hypothetical protein
MKALFIELPPFERHRQSYLNDESFREFQKMLMQNPESGDVIEGTGGLRKVRYADEKRGKGKRGGLRVIYSNSISSVTRRWLPCIRARRAVPLPSFARRRPFDRAQGRLVSPSK